ncbi:unannotated protein [freshwater metagenome]|uniref:Unannotated protein n=1 Tax=freshwater metagenome TaxID=449393 RepID=A0A6J7D8G6_9ZZZZ
MAALERINVDANIDHSVRAGRFCAALARVLGARFFTEGH